LAREEHSGVQGVLTLSYDTHENKGNHDMVSSATQLRAEDNNTVVLLEYNQEKKIAHEEYINKNSEKYRISAQELVSLIKEHGTKVD
jgi:serine/threonine protein phosphatase PrpC